MQASNETITFNVQTFGCKVNTYDTGLLQQRLVENGFQDQSENPHVHIVNTCAVTKEATKEAVKSIRKIKAKNPLSLVVVTGCGAQVDTGHFRDLPAADLVVANSHKGRLEEIIRRYYRGTLEDKVFKSNIFKKREVEAGGGREFRHTRTFLKIQDGCNSFCTFCVIPFARGKSRSIPVSDLVQQVRDLYREGVREVVLTGVHIGDYIDPTRSQGALEDLVEALLAKTQMPRFRLSSLEPIELSQRLLELYKDPRLCAHFHMSLQSAQSRVLQAMKRKYGHREVEQSLENIAKQVPGAFVGMDMIVGFPGETKQEFNETYERMAGLPWTKIHVFPYSPRPGTYANRLSGHHDRSVIMERAKSLRALSSERYARQALKQVGCEKQVLVLNKPARGGQGLSRDNWPIKFDASSYQAGEEVTVLVDGYDHSNKSRLEGCHFGTSVTDRHPSIPV